jgi:hypothetical protein
MLKENNPLAAQLLTKHNLCYMMYLMRTMRQALLEGIGAYHRFIANFFFQQFLAPKENIPQWVIQALQEVDIDIVSLTQQKQIEMNLLHC